MKKVKVDYRLIIDSKHIASARVERFAKLIHDHFPDGSVVDLNKGVVAEAAELEPYYGKRFQVLTFTGDIEPTFNGRFNAVVNVSLAQIGLANKWYPEAEQC